MNTKHTPGFWHWNEEEGTIVNFGGMVIADVRELRHESTSDVEEANARLIAAAPDLLEALKEALDQLESWNQESEPTFTMRRVAHAIAKATGTTNRCSNQRPGPAASHGGTTTMIKVLVVAGSEASGILEEIQSSLRVKKPGAAFLRRMKKNDPGGWDVMEFRNEQHYADFMDGVEWGCGNLGDPSSIDLTEEAKG